MIRMFFYSGVQAAISFSYVVSVTSRAFEFIDNGALIQAVSISSFPVDNKFTRRF